MRSSSGVVAQCRRRASVGQIQSETDHVKGEYAVHTERSGVSTSAGRGESLAPYVYH